MLAGKALVADIRYKLHELGLDTMSTSLGSMYKSAMIPGTDPLTIIANMVDPEYEQRITTRLNNRLKAAHLLGAPQDINNCVDSEDRKYIPSNVVSKLAELDFIKYGQNVCILGPSDSGKSYFAKALGISACTRYKVGYYHCDALLSDMSDLRAVDRQKYRKQLKKLYGLDLLILDDFLLHTVTDEEDAKLLFEIFEARVEACHSTMVCSQRDPESWGAMFMNDEVVADAIKKRATRYYTVYISPNTAS